MSEAHVIRERANALGIPAGRYLRECALTGKVVVTHPVAADQWASLARLAGNINTLTRHLNQGTIMEGKKLHPVLCQLAQLVSCIRSQLIQ